MKTFTVLGGSGFIGSHVAAGLREAGFGCETPERGADLKGRKLGEVVYCVGLTADFRARPLQTCEAHVTFLQRVLAECTFDSLLYLSSTRVYQGLPGPADEDAVLSVRPEDPDHLYNLSKLMGESLALSDPRGRVARLSNVYGGDFLSENFIASVLRDATSKKKVVLQTALDSEKDYVNVADVAAVLPKILLQGKRRIYNIAGGKNVTHRTILDRVQKLTGCTTEVSPQAPTVRQPPIAIGHARADLGFAPRDLLNDDLDALVALYARC